MADPHVNIPQVRKVALYLYGEPEPRLSQMRQIARDRGWEIAGEYLDCGPAGEVFARLLEADHADRHDATICWIGVDSQPALRLNQHHVFSAPATKVDPDDPLAVMAEAQLKKR